MEGSWGVYSAVSMSSEEITLTLNQSSRKTLGTQTIIVSK
jgi:hypothetical protein